MSLSIYIQKLIFIIFVFLSTTLLVNCQTPSQLLRQNLCSQWPDFQSNLSSSQSIKVFYKAEDKDVALNTLKAGEQAIPFLEKEFGTKLSRSFFIYIASNRKHFNEIVGNKTDDWVVGMALNSFELVILNPEGWTKKSKSYVNFKKLIKHEMIHAFSSQFRNTPNVNPCVYGEKVNSASYWFSEGLATLLSGQLDDWKERLKDYDWEKHGQFNLSLIKSGNYVVSATAIEFLHLKLGKKKLFSLLKGLPKNYFDKENHDKANRFLSNNIPNYQQLQSQWIEFVRKKYLID